MKPTVLVFLGVAMGISLVYAEPFEAPKLEPSTNGAVLASDLFPSQEYAAAFRYGVRNACNQPERATQRYANMLQANCVCADMSAGMDRSEIVRHCFAAAQRRTFIREAEEMCSAISAFPGFLLVGAGQSSQSGGCIPPKRFLRQ